MVCHKCKKEFPKGSCEHIVLEGLGGKTKTFLVFCEECNKSFSQIDKALIDQFAFAKNILGIAGKRGTVPSIIMTDSDSNLVRLTPGGKPVYLKPKLEEKSNGKRKNIEVSVPPHIWEQYKTKLERQYSIKIDEHNIKRVSEYPSLRRENCFGGAEALRAVAKMAYSFTCDHLERHDLSANLFKIENYIFNGIELEPDKISLLDSRFEIYEEVDDLSNVIVIHFGSEYRNIIASVTILGSFGYSVLLSRNYEGESYTIRMRNDPVNLDVEDVFENKPLERKIKTSWLLGRPYFPGIKKWTAMGQVFAEKYMKKVTDLHREMVQQEIVENCMKQAGFYNPNNSIVTEEMVAILSDCFAKQIVARFLIK